MDERFMAPGGGLVNHDLFARLVTLPDSQLIVLLGEGCFHQVHGGASTSPGADHAGWHAQYQKLRGTSYTRPEVDPVYFGRLPRPAQRWIHLDSMPA